MSMIYERRRSQRTPIQLETRWQGDLGNNDGQLSDLSAGGCFVLTSGRAAPRELIRLQIAMPAGNTLTVWGVVIEYFPEIGFSLRFTNLDETDQSYVENLVSHVIKYGESALKNQLTAQE